MCVVGDMDTCVLMFMWFCVDVGDVYDCVVIWMCVDVYVDMC